MSAIDIALQVYEKIWHSYIIFIMDGEGLLWHKKQKRERSLPMASDQQEPGDYHYRQKPVYIRAQLIG